jgi:hypothetical protein
MKRIFILMAWLAPVLLGAGPSAAQDGFYVIAGGGGAGTKITSVPYTITRESIIMLAQFPPRSKSTMPDSEG